MNYRETANKIAGTLIKRGKHRDSLGWDWDDCRDLCDIATSGELDAIQLDILTDMVSSRLKQQYYHETV